MSIRIHYLPIVPGGSETPHFIQSDQGIYYIKLILNIALSCSLDYRIKVSKLCLLSTSGQSIYLDRNT